MATVKVYITITETINLDFTAETLEGAIAKGKKYCDSWPDTSKTFRVDEVRTETEHLEKLYPHFVAPCTCRRIESTSVPGMFFIGGEDDCPVHGFLDREIDNA
jgi:hypothetical protein